MSEPADVAVIDAGNPVGVRNTARISLKPSDS